MIAQNASGEDLLRDAWAAASGDSRIDDRLRRSLHASAAKRPDLAPVLRELTGEDVRTELDLHLEGAGVKGHETNALRFGRFVTRFARTVKDFAKDLGGLAKLPTDLQILAPAPGSVRVVLRSPAPHRDSANLPHTAVTSLESLAMRQVVSLVLKAETDDDGIGSALTAAVYDLKGPTRHSLDLLARSVIDGNWDVVGELREPSRGVTPVRLSQRGAVRLADAARQTELVEDRDVAIVGTVDSWAWSTATMGFEPEGAPAFFASVPEHLDRKVASLLEDRPRTRGTFLVLTSYPQGDESSPRRSYSLVAIEELPETAELPF